MELKPIYGKIVTNVVERKYSDCGISHISLPLFVEGKFDHEYKKIPTVTCLLINENKREEVNSLAKIAWRFYNLAKYDKSKEIVQKIMQFVIRIDDDNEMDAWSKISRLMPGQTLMNSENHERRYWVNYFSRICADGIILEAFTGFNSLIESTVKKVIATDFCHEALERYPFPERERIQFDMNILDGTNKIGNFHDEMFDFILMSYGYKYPHKLRYIFREFFRILRPNGSLYLLEGGDYASCWVSKRKFVPQTCRRLLKKSGFLVIRIDTFNHWGFPGTHFQPDQYLVRAVKQ
jgi:SAM-dependent methyltransferase